MENIIPFFFIHILIYRTWKLSVPIVVYSSQSGSPAKGCQSIKTNERSTNYRKRCCRCQSSCCF